MLKRFFKKSLTHQRCLIWRQAPFPAFFDGGTSGVPLEHCSRAWRAPLYAPASWPGGCQCLKGRWPPTEADLATRPSCSGLSSLRIRIWPSLQDYNLRAKFQSRRSPKSQFLRSFDLKTIQLFIFFNCQFLSEK